MDLNYVVIFLKCLTFKIDEKTLPILVIGLRTQGLRYRNSFEKRGHWETPRRAPIELNHTLQFRTGKKTKNALTGVCNSISFQEMGQGGTGRTAAGRPTKYKPL